MDLWVRDTYRFSGRKKFRFYIPRVITTQPPAHTPGLSSFHSSSVLTSASHTFVGFSIFKRLFMNRRNSDRVKIFLSQ